MNPLDGLQPWLRPYAQHFYQVLVSNGLRPRLTSVFRTRQQQAALHRHNPSGLPAAAPGTSLHEVGRAFDLVVGDGRNSAWQAAAGRYWQQMGGTWLGARDPVHFSA